MRISVLQAFGLFSKQQDSRHIYRQTHKHKRLIVDCCVSAKPFFIIWDYGIPIETAPEETMLHFMGGNVQ